MKRKKTQSPTTNNVQVTEPLGNNESLKLARNWGIEIQYYWLKKMFVTNFSLD